MARLIDADEYNKKLKDHADKLYANIAKGATCPSLEWFDGLSYAQSVADNMPTVEAIPKEWIRTWLLKNVINHGEMFDLLMTDWEKENESIRV